MTIVPTVFGCDGDPQYAQRVNPENTPEKRAESSGGAVGEEGLANYRTQPTGAVPDAAMDQLAQVV